MGNKETQAKPATKSKETAANTAPKSSNKNAKTSSKANKREESTNKLEVTASTPSRTYHKELKLPTFRKIHIKARYVIFGALLLIIAAFFIRVAVWEHNYFLAMEGSERYTTTTEVYDGGEVVDSTEPTEAEIREYIVAPDKPRYLTIRSLGIYQARVVELGLKADGEMQAPTSAFDVGWYTSSALPGTNGASVIDGHGGNLGNGIFRNLPKIGVGAEIVIEMGDGRKFTYIVHDSTTRELGDDANSYMSAAFSSPTPGTASLTLITCTGDWLMAQQTYSQRLFVRALLK